MADVITCDACIGRNTQGAAYCGAQVSGNTVILKQHTFDYDVVIQIGISSNDLIYGKVIVKSLSDKCIRTCIPKRPIRLTELGFMRLNLSDEGLQRYFKLVKRGCK